jgi:phosphinothricin acetyltransferase
MIAEVSEQHAARVCEIYNHYVRATSITFETEEIAVPEMQARIAKARERHAFVGWLDQGTLLGYAYASKFRERKAYDATAETTIYLDPAAFRKGIGAKLYADLLARLAKSGFHAAIGVIALPNVASVALHEKAGFKKAGHLPEVGKKFGKWIDIGFWEKAL